MTDYVTVADVDTLFGPTWNGTGDKTQAVFLANVWLGAKNLPTDLDPVPAEWAQAGAYIARDAAAGLIFTTRETGLASSSVSAGSVSSSKTYTPGSRTVTAGEAVALALLAPWVSNSIIWLARA